MLKSKLKMMKIGRFVTKFPYKIGNAVDYTYGGAVRQAYYLTEQEAKKNRVTVFTTSKDRKETIEFQKNKLIKVHRYGVSFDNYSLDLCYKPAFQETDFDIVHCHTGGDPAPLLGAYFLKIKKKNTPLIVTHHGDYNLTRNPFNRLSKRLVVPFHRKLILKLLKKADVIFSPSEHFAEKSPILSKFGKKVEVVPRAIKQDEYKIPMEKKYCKKKLNLQDKKLILFMGKLKKHKGPHVLLKALKKVVRETSSITLVMAGEGELKEKLKRLSEKLGIRKYTRFPGYVKNLRKKMLLKASDLFVLPSFGESFGFVVLEAMTFKTPVVASNVGGIPELVKDEENGILVPPGDSRKLSVAILRLLTDEKLRAKLVKRAKETVKQFSLASKWKSVKKIYKKFLR